MKLKMSSIKKIDPKSLLNTWNEQLRSTTDYMSDVRKKEDKKLFIYDGRL